MRLFPRPRLRQHPRRSLLVAGLLLLSLLYLTLWIVEKTKFGRWYWNYAAAIHPVLLYIMPPGKWNPIDRPPRWVQEIHDAPWMGEWDLPELSRPVFERRGHDDAHQEQLTSPVLVKLHVFSTAFPGARAKRDLIRKLSPLLNIPVPYRHLVELKFVLGHAEDGAGQVDEAVEALLAEEQDEYGDLIRLHIAHGENMNEGKTLDWLRAVGTGQDGGREAWWLFKVDDDCVLNIAKLLDTLLTLDHHQPHYLGTSLNRWPGYHHHFTGMSMGFSWGLVRTLSSGIGQMTREAIETTWDEDVLMGELMFCLPSAPHCRKHPPHSGISDDPLPDYCDPHAPPPWGYLPPPPYVDPRTHLVRYDFLLRMSDKGVWWASGEVARHSKWFKPLDGYEREWERRIKGKMWEPPTWLELYADAEAR